jgi:predicted phage baseplate assembly protein
VALPAPNLDDRRFQDLVDDATRLVRRRCPGWTDHNLSDPGVTLIETFAFMVDQLFYRLNRVPERLHVKFLDLIGVRLFPPTPARTDLTFWLAGPATTAMTIGAGTEAGTVRTESVDSVVFSTTQDCVAVPCTLTAVRTRGAGDEVSADQTTALRAGPVTAFGAHPVPGDVLLLALDVAVPRCAVRIEVDGHVDGVGVDPDDPPLVWEAHNGETWTGCRVLRDETGGLTTAGAVVLDVAADHRVGLLDGHRGGWLRARVVAPADGQPSYRASPTVRRVAACTVGVSGPAINARTVRAEDLGSGDGAAGQTFQVAERPVLGGVGEPVVEVSSAEGWEEWTRVDHFATSTSEDRHFVLDGYTGEVVFGPLVREADGSSVRHGAAPPAGAVVRIREYAVGGGVTGNVTAGAVSTLRTSVPFVAAVENVTAATGGVDAETLAEARDRGALTLRTRARAVTAEDYEVLAREAAPEVARIRCITAGEGGVPAATVKVLVVPTAPTENGLVRLADLLPPDEVLERLADRLDQVRLIGTLVLVEPPRYRGVTVVARLVARPRVDTGRVRRQALSALTHYLSPLPGGGPDGHGWPFGRAVAVGEVHGVLHRVPGVDVVEDVRLFSANPVTGERGGESTRIELEANSLVFSFEHQVRVEAG